LPKGGRKAACQKAKGRSKGEGGEASRQEEATLKARKSTDAYLEKDSVSLHSEEKYRKGGVLATPKVEVHMISYREKVLVRVTPTKELYREGKVKKISSKWRKEKSNAVEKVAGEKQPRRERHERQSPGGHENLKKGYEGTKQKPL